MGYVYWYVTCQPMLSDYLGLNYMAQNDAQQYGAQNSIQYGAQYSTRYGALCGAQYSNPGI